MKIIFIILFPIIVFGKKPPSISDSMGKLRWIVEGYHRDLDFMNRVELSAINLEFGDCSRELLLTQVKVSQCILLIDRLTNEINHFMIRFPFVEENINSIPGEFGPIAQLIRNDFNNRKQKITALGISLKLKADSLFEVLKSLVKIEFNQRLVGIRNSAKTKAICSTFNSDLEIIKLMNSYYEEINGDFSQFDQLNLKLANLIWGIELVSDSCAVKSSTTDANNLYYSIAKKVTYLNYYEYRNHICDSLSSNYITFADCMELKYTPESVWLLNYLNHRKDKKNEN